MSKQITVAAVVIMLAITPTWLDVWQVWKHPEKFQEGVPPRQIRTTIALWYLLLLFVALSAWRMFA